MGNYVYKKFVYIWVENIDFRIAIQCDVAYYIIARWVNVHCDVLPAVRIFLNTLLERADLQYLNCHHFSYEVRTGMCEILTRSRLWFMCK